MTLKIELDFKKSNLNLVLKLLDWVKESGIIQSLKISSQKELVEDETDLFFAEMIAQGKQDIENGDVYTNEEAKTVAEEWLKERMQSGQKKG